MSKDVFVWSKKDYSFTPERIVQNKLGWSITNGGYLSMRAKDGEWYNFPPESIDCIMFFKPQLFKFSGGVAICVNQNYSDFVNDKYGTDIITLDDYLGWKTIKKDQTAVMDILTLAHILSDNGIAIQGAYDAFFKLMK